MAKKKKTKAKKARVKHAELPIVGQGLDPDEQLFRPLVGSPNDLSPLQYERAVSISRSMWERDGLPAYMIELPRKAINHGGITWEAEDPKVQAVLDDWWSDGAMPFVDDFMGKAGASLLTSNYVNGELVLPVKVHKHGQVEFAYIDTLNIEEVKKDKDNALRFDQIVMKRDAQGNQQKFKVIRRKIDGSYDGDAFHFPLNIPPNGLRGRPYLQRFINLLDSYMSFVENEVDRSVILKSFLYMFKIDGSDEVIQQEFKDRYFPGGRPPNPGTVVVGNENLSGEIMNQSLNAADNSQMAEFIKLATLGPTGFPIFFFGSGGNVNNTVSREMMTVAGWSISEIIDYVHTALKTISTFVVHQAKLKGRNAGAGALSMSTNDKHELLIGSPFPRDEIQGSATLMQITNAANAAMMNDIYGLNTAREVVAVGLKALGIEKTADEMKKEVEAENDDDNDDDGKSDLTIDDLDLDNVDDPFEDIEASPPGERPNFGERETPERESKRDKIYTKDLLRRFKTSYRALTNGSNGKEKDG